MSSDFWKVCQAHLSEEEEDLEKGRWRVWVQLQGTTGASVSYMGKNVNQSWPDSSVGLQHSKLCAAEDFEPPLIIVQSIKSEQLNSLTAFGKGLLTTIFWISQSLCPWDSPNLRSFAPSKNSTRCRFHGLSLQGLSLSLYTAFICAFANPTIFYNTFQFSLYKIRLLFLWSTRNPSKTWCHVHQHSLLWYWGKFKYSLLYHG